MAIPSEQRINVPVDDPSADTEWNDILRKHGVIPEKPPSPTLFIEEAILEEQRLSHENRLEGKDLDDLDELEDLEDEEFLENYRQQRVQELAALSKKALHGSVYSISKPDYSHEVTDASTTSPVLVHLTGNNAESRVLSELWRHAAGLYGEIKFCEIRAEMAIEEYPERNCPTILVYKDRDIVKQIVTLVTLGGAKISMREIEALLLHIGAVKDNDMRVLKGKIGGDDAEEEGGESLGIKGPSTAKSENDDDWD